MSGIQVLNRLDKRLAVILRICCDRSQRIGHKREHYTFIDAVLRRAARPTGNLRVVGTGVLRNELTIIDTVNIHLGPAVGAIQQSRQRSRFTPTVGVSTDVCSDALHVFKGLLVDHGLVCVFKDAPFTFMDIVAFLVLEVLSCLEVDGMAEVLPLFENTHDDRRIPGIGGL